MKASRVNPTPMLRGCSPCRHDQLLGEPPTGLKLNRLVFRAGLRTSNGAGAQASSGEACE